MDTERKPAGMNFETWVDKAVRDAEERGAFADLPGAGKPIPGAGTPDDELWWVQAKLRQERLTFIPPSLALRKDVEEIHDCAAAKRTEADVRRLVAELNVRITASIRTGISGPPIAVMPLNPDSVVATWSEGRAAAAQTQAGNHAGTPANEPAEPKVRWRVMFGRPKQS